MKGDFSRHTFKPQKHYSGVRMQQGRVLLDADWNEQVDIANHRMETEAADAIGLCGAPEDHAGFKLAEYTVTNNQKSILIGAGRFYVDGILCENETAIDFSDQEDFPGEPLPLKNPAEDTYFLAYLDVWQHHLTVLDDSDLHEVALEAPDTTTRTKTVWQVKLLKDIPADTPCGKDFTDWTKLVKPRAVRLAAQATPLSSTTTDPCAVVPNAGFRGIANQLYRVEIHQPGPLGTATFKWSRDNGSIAGRIQSLDPDANTIVICEPPRDDVLAFKLNDWVEVISDAQERRGEPGILVRLNSQTQGTSLIYDPDTAVPDGPLPEIESSPEKTWKVRQWHPTSEAELVTSTEWTQLADHGIHVRFETGAAEETYKTGDYWLIPARTVTGNIDWPVEGKTPKFLEPFGIKHHYCRLAICKLDKDGNWHIDDCRPIFSSLVDQINLFYLSGDGQEAMPGEMLLQPLRVGVTNGLRRIAGAQVKFEVKEGGGRLFEKGGKTSLPSSVPTDLDGTAQCFWKLGDVLEKKSQYVEATLLDASQKVLHLPIRFNANLSLASEIAFPDKCEDPPYEQEETKKTISTALRANAAHIAANHTDRRQFVPLLAQTLPCLHYRDGRHHSFAVPNPTGLVFDGRYVWAGSAAEAHFFRIDETADDPMELITSIETTGLTYYGAFDGERVWFTSPYQIEENEPIVNEKVFFININEINFNEPPPSANILQVGLFPTGIAFDGVYIWVANYLSKTVSIIDVHNEVTEVEQKVNKPIVLRTITLRGEDGQPIMPTNLAFDGSYIWIGGEPGSIFRIKKTENNLWADPELVADQLEIFPRELAFDGSHVWVVNCLDLTESELEKKPSPIYKINVHTLAVTKLDGDSYQSHGAIFDGRNMWLLNASPVTSHLLDVHFVDLDIGWAVGDAATVVKTIDGGKTWQRQNVPAGLTENLNAVFFSDELKGSIVGNNGTIRYTTDGGNTWNEPQSSEEMSEHLHSIQFLKDVQTGWAVGNKGNFWKTANGGESWEKQSITLKSNGPSVEANLYGIHFVDKNFGWIVGSNATILATSDGKNWRTQNPPAGVKEHLRDVHFVDQKQGCAVGNNGTILITENGGESWILKKAMADTSEGEQKEINAHFNAVQFINAFTGWIIGNDATILRTNSSGNDWVREEMPQEVTAHLRGGYFLGEPNDNQSATGRVVGDDATILTYDFRISTPRWLEQSPPQKGGGLMHKVDVGTNIDTGSIVLDRAPLSGVFDGTHLWLSLTNHRVQKWLVG